MEKQGDAASSTLSACPEKIVQKGEIVWGSPDEQKTEQKAVSSGIERSLSIQNPPVITSSLQESSEGITAPSDTTGEPRSMSAAPQDDKTVRRNLSMSVAPTNSQLTQKSSEDEEEWDGTDSQTLEGRIKLQTLKTTKIKRIKQLLEDDPQIKAMQEFAQNLGVSDPKLLNPMLIGSIGLVLMLLFRFYL